MCGGWTGNPPNADCARREEGRYNNAKRRIGTNPTALKIFNEGYQKSFASPFDYCSVTSQSSDMASRAYKRHMLRCIAGYESNTSRFRVYLPNAQGRTLRANSRMMTRQEYLDWLVELAKKGIEGGVIGDPRITPPNVIKFSKKLGGRLGMQFERLFRDLLKHAPYEMQSSFDPKGIKYRTGLGDDLITKVKVQLNITNPEAIARDENDPRRKTLTLRLAATLGHNVRGTTRPKAVIKEIEKDVRANLISSNDDYKTVDAKRRMLNNAYYNHFEHGEFKGQKIGKKGRSIRQATLTHAAKVLKTKLGAYMAAKKGTGLDIRDVIVKHVEIDRKHIKDTRNRRITTEVIVDIKFDIAKGVPSDVLEKVVYGNKYVKFKMLAKAAVERMWRTLAKKDPRANDDPKVRRKYAKQFKEKLFNITKINHDNGANAKFKGADGKPSGAIALMNTYVDKVDKPKTKVGFKVNPKQLNNPLLDRSYSRDRIIQLVREKVYIPAVAKAKDGSGKSIGKPNIRQKKAIAEAVRKKVDGILEKHGMGGLEGTVTVTKVIVKKVPVSKNHPHGYDVDVEVSVAPGTAGTRDVGKNATFDSMFVGRAGVGDRTKKPEGAKDKAKFTGYVFLKGEYVKNFGGNLWQFILGAKALLLSGSGNMALSSDMPHTSENPDVAFVKFSPYMGIGRKLSDAWSAKLVAGLVSPRSFFLDHTAFDSSSHAHEVSLLPDSGSVAGAELSAAGKATKNLTLKAKLMLGKTYSLIYDPNKTFARKPTSTRIVGSIAAGLEVFDKKLTLEGALTVDYAKGAGESVQDSAGDGTTVKYDALAIIFDAALGYKLTANQSPSDAMILLSMRNYHQINNGMLPEHTNRLEAGLGFRYRHNFSGTSAFSGAANVNYFQQQGAINWNDVYAGARGGQDGVHDATDRGVTLDAMLLYHVGPKRFNLGIGPFGHISYDATSGQIFWAAGLHVQGELGN